MSPVPHKVAPPEQPIRLRELHIKDFRGIDQLHLELSLPVTVLAGANGMGKTSILESALICVGAIDLLANDARPFREQVRFGARDFELRALLDVPEEWLNRPSPREDGRLEVSMNASACDVSFRDVERTNRAALEELYRGAVIRNTPTYEFFKRWEHRVEYFSARRSPALVQALGLSIGRSERDPRDERTRLHVLKQALIDLWAHARLQERAGTDVSVFERLNATWSRFHPASNEAFVVLPVSDDPADGFDVFLRTSEHRRGVAGAARATAVRDTLGISAPPLGDDEVVAGQTLVALDELSSGEMAILLLAMPLVVGKKTVDIFVIDEPEQHLHVQWQKLIIPMLSDLSPATQFLVATQSEHVLDSVLHSQQRILLSDGDPRAIARNS